MKDLFIFLSLILSLSSWAGGSGAGNGGDTVRMGFFSIGNNIIDYYQEGFKKIDSVIKDPQVLRNYLNIEIVHTSVDLLLDNQGNPVNAIGEKHKIILYVGNAYKDLSWTSILKDQREAKKLILHEMLRAHGVNDDNYVYSEIVLFEQDIAQEGPFKLKWSRDSIETINSSLLLSLKAAADEAALYEKAVNSIKKINNLPYANLLSLQVKLSEGILAHEKFSGLKASMLRKDLRNIKDLIPMVDTMAFEKIKHNASSVSAIKKVALIILRDFSMKLAEYHVAGSKIFSENLSDISNALNTDEDFKNSCSRVNDVLDMAKEALDSNESKRDVLKKIQMAVFALRQGQC